MMLAASDKSGSSADAGPLYLERCDGCDAILDDGRLRGRPHWANVSLQRSDRVKHPLVVPVRTLLHERDSLRTRIPFVPNPALSSLGRQRRELGRRDPLSVSPGVGPYASVLTHSNAAEAGG
jgi:hypothetical protein